MKKGEILEGTVERIEFPNKGIVVCEEGSCVVKNALPGQRVSFRVSKARLTFPESFQAELLYSLHLSPKFPYISAPIFVFFSRPLYLASL